MAEEPELKPIDSVEPEETPGYAAPAKKSLDEIANLDADDESLAKYKETLLGDDTPTGIAVRVTLWRMALLVEGRDDVEVDLTKDLDQLKEKPFTIKEGVEYRIKLVFMVHHEIVSGLRYHHETFRKGIRVDKQSFMVGSYGPSVEEHSYITPPEEAPKGMLARGHYAVKSKVIDDDKNAHLEWEWAFDIVKDWD